MTLEEEGEVLKAVCTTAHNKYMAALDECILASVRNAGDNKVSLLFLRIIAIENDEMKPAHDAYDKYLDRSIEAINQAQRIIKGML